MARDPSTLPEWHSETGHWFTLDHPDERSGKDDWGVVIKHPGDPSGHWIRAGLGRSHVGIGQRVLRELSRPDVMHEMYEQMRRAWRAGDPRGTIGAQGGPGRFGEEHTEVRHLPLDDGRGARAAGQEGGLPRSVVQDGFPAADPLAPPGRSANTSPRTAAYRRESPFRRGRAPGR